MKTRKTQSLRSLQRMVGPIPHEELKKAMMKDFDQRCIDSLTPDRGYGFPMDNVEVVILKYWPNDSSSPAAGGDAQPKQSDR